MYNFYMHIRRHRRRGEEGSKDRDKQLFKLKFFFNIPHQTCIPQKLYAFFLEARINHCWNTMFASSTFILSMHEKYFLK